MMSIIAVDVIHRAGEMVHKSDASRPYLHVASTAPPVSVQVVHVENRSAWMARSAVAATTRADSPGVATRTSGRWMKSAGMISEPGGAVRRARRVRK